MYRIAILAVLLGLGACRKTPTNELVVERVTAPFTPVVETEPPPPPPPVVDESLASVNLRTVYFDFDKSDLRPDSLRTLAVNTRQLQERPDVRIRVEGNCDERGTVEYNLALGERRATSVKDYLVYSGVPASRIDTMSFGEDNPVALGHDEASWAMNRRVDFAIVPASLARVR